jgi:proteasome accessory factor C
MPESDPTSQRRRSTQKASERLRRLLVVVPYLVRHPGTSIAEASSLFGLREEELVEDLNLLFVSGLPPYGPGDLIDVDIQDGRVWITMADYFARPLRLTRNEALALYLRGTAAAATPGLPEAPALAAALEKLRTGLGAETLGELPERVQAAGGGSAAEPLEALRRAARDRERVRIEYHAASSGERTVRDVDPEEVFHAIGNWYVVAWDGLSDAERLFRADRIRTVEGTGEHFERRGLAGAGRPLYTPGGSDVPIRLLLRPEARWVAEYYEVDATVERPDGDLEVVLPAGRIEWVERLLLRLGPDAVALEPSDLTERVRDLARRTLDRYR